MSKTLELIFKTSLDKPVKLQLIKFDAVLTEQLVKRKYESNFRIRHFKIKCR